MEAASADNANSKELRLYVSDVLDKARKLGVALPTLQAVAGKINR